MARQLPRKTLQTTLADFASVLIFWGLQEPTPHVLSKTTIVCQLGSDGDFHSTLNMVGVTPSELPSSFPMSTSSYIHWHEELEDVCQFVFQLAAFAFEDGMVSDLSEGRSMDWQDWLSSRLHSWGMLSLVDEVLKVAVLGNLTELRELVLQALLPREGGDDGQKWGPI
jgi:hypothetical protein